MLSLPRWAAIAASLLLLSPTSAVPTPEDIGPSRDALAPRADDDWHWVATWTSMPQLVEPNNMPPSPFVSSNTPPSPIRLVVQIGKSQGMLAKNMTGNSSTNLSSTPPPGCGKAWTFSSAGARLRLRRGKNLARARVPITAASMTYKKGLEQRGGHILLHGHTCTLDDGSSAGPLPRGQVAYTDPIDFDAAPQANIAVSIYSQPGQSGSSITGHPGSRTTSHMQSGNRVSAATLSGGANTKHWYFVSAVEAWAPPEAGAFVILGDSITDGRGSTDDGNDRWPDLLLARLQKAGNLSHVGVNNQAAGGNAVLNGGLGPTLLTRYERDALRVAGVKWVMVFEGVNDIGGGGTDSGTQNGIGSRLQQAFEKIARDCKAAGIKTIGGTITPFGGNGQSYSNPTREQTRVKVNDWILKSGTFDATVDFGALIGDPSVKSQLARQYDGGDHLHPNVAGYQAMANGFPLDFFK